MKLSEFIIHHDLLGLNNNPNRERNMSMIMSRQKDVFGFGENTKTLRAIGEDFGMSRQTVRQITQQARRRLETRLNRLKVKEIPVDQIVVVSIDTLDPIDVRLRNCLMNAGIRTVNELVESWDERRLLKLPNFGRKSLNELKERLIAMGLSLKI